MKIEENPRYKAKLDRDNAKRAERDAANAEGYDSSKPPSDGPQRPPKRKEGKKYLKTTEEQQNSSFEKIATILSYLIIVITFPICLFFCFTVIKEYKRAVFFRLGRVRKGARGPGLVWFLPCIDNYILVDLRTRVEVIPTQEMLTRDSVTISVDAVLFYYIEGSLHATLQISNVHESSIFIAQTTLRNIVGSRTLHELLTSRESLSETIGNAVDHATEKWGVRIERVALKDINLPESLQRSMASEAESLREARAKIISAEGEVLASQSLKEASDVMSENKITLQLRHLQILTSIAHERNLTILYPFPMDMMAPFQGGGSKKAKQENDPPVNAFESLISSVVQPVVWNKHDQMSKEIETKPTAEPQNLAEEQANPTKKIEQVSDSILFIDSMILVCIYYSSYSR
ncbi:GH17310 [Drosophila grimshawi]|uniref:GH17310 n=1 Tax=Drosophila grimshawi TaxID=7222 RepID=B4JUL1_DROGR|nr:GH17310 [Drosophila grimshawi]